MGRKSTPKKRKKRNQSVVQWTQSILPKLRKKELGNLTMDDLSALMNKSKSTIYEYFSTKEEIFEYITETRIQQLRAYKNEISLHSFSATFPYESFVDILSRGVKDISSFYLSELKIHYPTAWKIVMDFLNELLSDLKHLYSMGIENKIFRSISPELMIKLDEYFIVKLITDYRFLESTGQTLEVVIKNYLLLKFEGLKISN